MEESKLHIAFVHDRSLPELIWHVKMNNGEIKEIPEEDAWLMVTDETEWTYVKLGGRFRRGQQIYIAVFWKGWPGEPTLEKKEDVELMSIYQNR
jgi:hypothetical protein